MALRHALVFATCLTALCSASPADEKLVKEHVYASANQTFREPQGFLKHKYLVPGGPYNQLWDWDSVMTGVALIEHGSAPYLAGSMMNFFDATNLSTGEVKGCVTPDGTTPTIFHAKPVIIQGAWLAAKHVGASQFKKYRPHMQAQIRYWETVRRDNASGLYVWYNQLESGADNLPISQCPSSRSKCWATSESLTMASSDVLTFLHREHLAFAAFLTEWGDHEQAQTYQASAEDLASALNQGLWDDDKGLYIAYNVSSKRTVANRVYLLAFPIFAGLPSLQMARRALSQVTAPDMLSRFGIRSTSRNDPAYNNRDEIKPYSNWQGPVWVVANALIAYGLQDYNDENMTAAALDMSSRVITTLADDLRETGTWHECYSGETGHGLAAKGFLSWNTLGADLMENLRSGRNPFRI